MVTVLKAPYLNVIFDWELSYKHIANNDVPPTSVVSVVMGGGLYTTLFYDDRASLV